MTTYTHAELVALAERWLRNSVRCSVVLCELHAATGTGEIPDAIGWNSTITVLVECKATRADFLADRRKRFRVEPSAGMGVYRYFLAPPGLIGREELPLGWGLLIPRAKTIQRIVGHDPRSWKEPPPFPFCNRRAEAIMLLSALNRLRLGLGEAEFRRLTHARIMQKTTAELDAEAERAAAGG